jgi:hypothetical protein
MQLVPLLVGNVPVLDGRRAHRDRVAATTLAGKSVGKSPGSFYQYVLASKPVVHTYMQVGGRFSTRIPVRVISAFDPPTI